MSSQQKQIRDAIVAKVATATGRTVFRSPRRGLAKSELPAVCVYSQGDRAVNDDDDHSQSHERIYTVRVEVQVEGRPEDDATDTICAQIRTAVLAEDTQGNLAHRTLWADQTWDGDEGEWPLAGSAMDFAVFYLWRP